MNQFSTETLEKTFTIRIDPTGATTNRNIQAISINPDNNTNQITSHTHTKKKSVKAVELTINQLGQS